MRYCGYIHSPIKSPVIYFITSYDVIYIGETQFHPVKRWNSHLFVDGDFRRNLEMKGDSEVNYFEKLFFFAYYCDSIVKNFPEVQWRITTQAVEHQVHCFVCQYPSKIGKNLRIISETNKTVPRRFGYWSFANQLAMEVVEDFAHFYQQTY